MVFLVAEICQKNYAINASENNVISESNNLQEYDDHFYSY